MKTQTVSDYIKSGGKVTTCPPTDATTKQSRHFPARRRAPTNGFDPVCSSSKCPNVGKCEAKCSPLSWVNGDTPQRECQIDLRTMDTIRPDYKETISELANLYDWPTLLDDVRAIQDTKQRLIFAGLLANITQADIATLMHITRQTLYRFLRRVRAK